MGLEKFYNELNKYEEAGVFKEVLANDKSIVYNVVNQFYLAFAPEMYMKEEHAPVGLAMNANGLKNIAENPNYFFEYFNNISEESRKQITIELSDDYLKQLIDLKSKYNNNLPPTNNIDLELEENIKQKNK